MPMDINFEKVQFMNFVMEDEQTKKDFNDKMENDDKFFHKSQRNSASKRRPQCKKHRREKVRHKRKQLNKIKKMRVNTEYRKQSLIKKINSKGSLQGKKLVKRKKNGDYVKDFSFWFSPKQKKSVKNQSNKRIRRFEVCYDLCPQYKKEKDLLRFLYK